MKKLLTIAVALALICAYVYAAPQTLVNNIVSGATYDGTNTLVFTARGRSMKVYTSVGDVALITPNYTNSALTTTYPKWIGTTEKTFENIFSVNSVASLKFTANNTNAIYILIYND